MEKKIKKEDESWKYPTHGTSEKIKLWIGDQVEKP